MNKRLIAILVVILTAGLVITGCTAGAGSEPTATVGNAAPDFQLQSLDGQSITLSSLRGNPVLINFWATWCGPCASEVSYLQEIDDEWSDKGLVVLAINWGESAAQVEQFLQAHNLSFQVLLDTNKAAAEKYGIRAFPTTFFIDKDGIIQVKVIGAFPNKAAIESRLSVIMP
jgi:cytochrome c biogenesis protein CcmG/thiol:disulfide interchange protein DsbE